MLLLTEKDTDKIWKEDCLFHHGRVLDGKMRHYCPEWDFLPMDNTCWEFEACTCFDNACVEV